MDQQTRIARHSTLWATQNTRMARLVSGVLVFAVVVQWKVAEPYADVLNKTHESRIELKRLAKEQHDKEQKLKRLQASSAELERGEKVLVSKPWERHKQELESTIKRLNQSHGTLPQVKQAADKTIQDIQREMDRSVASLKTALNNEQLKGTEEAKRARTALDGLAKDIHDWATNAVAQTQPWYKTKALKAAKVRELAVTIQNRKLDETVNALVPPLQRARETLQRSLAANKKALKQAQALAADATQRRDKLDKQLEAILPGWLDGLIDVPDLVGLFPLVLIAAVLSIVATALSLTQHYKAIARGKGWEPGDRNDPAFSSLWTLTYRGRWGTALSLGTYVSVTLTLGYFLVQSRGVIGAIDKTLAGPDATPVEAPTVKGVKLINWIAQVSKDHAFLVDQFSNAVVLVAIATLVAMPLWDRSRNARLVRMLEPLPSGSKPVHATVGDPS